MPSSAANNSKNPEPNAALMAEILTLLAGATERFEPDDKGMRQWITQRFHNPQIVELMEEMTVMMFRVLGAIGELEPANGATISKQFRIPKGSVSKSTRRLIAKKLITSEALPNNKKETLFRLTNLGREVFEAHRAFDQEMEKGFFRFLQRYSATELQLMIKVLQDMMAVSFLDLAAETEANEAAES